MSMELGPEGTMNDADEILGRVRECIDRGEEVDLGALLEAHPHLAAELRVRFAALNVLDHAFGDLRSAMESSEPTASTPPSQLGRYRIQAEIGAGGMGTVYSAVTTEDAADLAAGRLVAVKVFHPHLASRSMAQQRFRREAEIGRRIRHPNVVRTYGMGVEESDPGPLLFLAMEHVEGRTLRELLREQRSLPEGFVRELGAQISSGLAAIHDAGAVHRDLKPENVLVTDDDQVRIMDLGVARLVEAAVKLTREGAFAGSVLYAAPEQFSDRETGPAADLYALGVLLHELAVGEHPFLRDSTAAVIRAHLDEVPVPVIEQDPDISPFLSEMVRSLLAKDPAQRPSSAEGVAEILRQGEASAWWAEREREILRRQRERPRVPVRRETRLHGRRSEVAFLRDAWDAAKRGEGTVALLQGEAGIGKSRCVDAFLEEVEEPAHVLYGSFAPGGTTGAVRNALLGHFGRAGLEDSLEPYLEDVSRLIPAFAGLIRRDAVRPRTSDLPEEAQQALLVELMRGLARERPLLWVIEDLHFADGEGRHVAYALARAIRGKRGLVILTARSAPPTEDLADLMRLDHVRRVELGRLSPREVVELLRDAFRSEALAEKLGVQISYKSDGVPFFVFEMIRGLREGQFISRLPDGSYVESKIVDQIDVPEAVRDLVNVRLRDLAKEERALLDVAAVQGYEFDADLLARVLERRRVAVLQDLADLERRSGVIRTTGGRHRFDHHQIHEVLMEDLGPALGSEYHALLADAYQARLGAPLEGEDARFVARHHLLGSRPAEARDAIRPAVSHLLGLYENEAALELGWLARDVDDLLPPEEHIGLLLDAARASRRVGRWSDERELLERGRNLAMATGDPFRRAETGLRLGEALTRAGRTEEALEIHRDAEALALEAGSASLWCRVAAAVGSVLDSIGRSDEALETLTRALDVAVEEGDPGAEMRARGGLAGVYVTLSRYEDALASYERQRELGKAEGARATEINAAMSVGIVLRYAGRYGEARRQLAWVLDACREIGDRQTEASAHGNLGNLDLREGSYDEARDHYLRQLDLAEDMGFVRAVASALGNLGIVEKRRGRYDEARDHFERSLAAARASQDRGGELRVLGNLGSMFLDLDRTAEARPLLEQVLAGARDIKDPRSELWADERLANIALKEGRLAEARDRFDRAARVADTVGDREWQSIARSGLAYTLLHLGLFDDAANAFRQARAIDSDTGQRQGEGYNEAGLGLLALHRGGDVEEAHRHLSRALRIAEEGGAPRYAAIARLGLGRVALERGDPGAARAHLEAAMAAGREMDLPALLAPAAALRAVASAPEAAVALEVLEQTKERLSCLDAMEVRYLLWRVTSDPAHLEAAHRQLTEIQAEAASAGRDGSLAAVPLHDRILRAWRDAGSAEDAGRPSGP